MANGIECLIEMNLLSYIRLIYSKLKKVENENKVIMCLAHFVYLNVNQAGQLSSFTPRLVKANHFYTGTVRGMRTQHDRVSASFSFLQSNPCNCCHHT